jgi:hypothetical protein
MRSNIVVPDELEPLPPDVPPDAPAISDAIKPPLDVVAAMIATPFEPFVDVVTVAA